MESALSSRLYFRPRDQTWVAKPLNPAELSCPSTSPSFHPVSELDSCKSGEGGALVAETPFE